MSLSLRESICTGRGLLTDPEIIAGRAELLCSRDRELVEATLVRGQSVASVARIMGVSQKTLGRKVRGLAFRLASCRFLSAAKALPYLSTDEAEIARLRYCQGVSARRLAREHGVSGYVMRRRLDAISAKISAICRMVRDSARRMPQAMEAADEDAWSSSMRRLG